MILREIHSGRRLQSIEGNPFRVRMCGQPECPRTRCPYSRRNEIVVLSPTRDVGAGLELVVGSRVAYQNDDRHRVVSTVPGLREDSGRIPC